MAPYDEDTERYLNEFRPQTIRELEVAPRPGNVSWRRLAAAAALVVCAGGIFWFARSESKHRNQSANVQAPKVSITSQRQYRTTAALTKLALSDNEGFEILLAEESRKSLPNFQGEQSALKVLAKD
jgi:hypothetical protein